MGSDARRTPAEPLWLGGEPVPLRRWGDDGPMVVALHGGPAARGSAAPIARELAGNFTVLEPWQRGSGGQALTVAGHVADLHEVVLACGQDRPAVVGESWGAMLALAYAAEHPDSVGPLVLVGCGTFDVAAREAMQRTIDRRLTDADRSALQRLETDVADPAQRLVRQYEIIRSVYEVDPLSEEEQGGAIDWPMPLDTAAHRQSWQDMLARQQAGDYPAAFASIRSPVLMLHGTYDPHPGEAIRDRLATVIPQLEYHPLDRSGHCPWRERNARDEFFRVLIDWLKTRLAGSRSGA